MKRRTFLSALGALYPVSSVFAGHGWESYDTARPLYLEGEVTTLIWADPHPHLELLHRPGTRIPADLRRRAIPSQKETVDTATLLQRAAVPVTDGEIWRVELPSLLRLRAWDVPRPKIKKVIGLIGYRGPQLLDTPTVRPEILFIDGKAYPMRSDPA